MPMSHKTSAGTLLYRSGAGDLEVLLVHASGWYNRKAPWSIPKGEPDAEETDLEQTARRETWEETGVRAGELVPLGHIVYKKSRKQVHCYAGPAPADAEPRPASWEVDQVRFMPVEEARQLLHEDQREFVDRLLEHLGKR
jgi:predicted NUDIX family NTP pyrophosphohydrolase